MEELAPRKGVRLVESVDDMARPGLFESDEEWQEFVRWPRSMRRIMLTSPGTRASPCSPGNRSSLGYEHYDARLSRRSGPSPCR